MNDTADEAPATLDETHCPCAVAARIRVEDPNPHLSTDTFADIGAAQNESGVARTSLTNTYVVAVPTNTVVTVTASAAFHDEDVVAVGFDAQISAVYVPFGSNGGHTL